MIRRDWRAAVGARLPDGGPMAGTAARPAGGEVMIRRRRNIFWRDENGALRVNFTLLLKSPEFMRQLRAAGKVEIR